MPRILLIDDDQGLAQPLRDYLLRYGMELESVTHPTAGLERMRLDPPDLLILDIMLPDMDGPPQTPSLTLPISHFMSTTRWKTKPLRSVVVNID